MTPFTFMTAVNTFFRWSRSVTSTSNRFSPLLSRVLWIEALEMFASQLVIAVAIWARIPFSSLQITRIFTGSALFLPLFPVSYTHLRAHETDSYLVCRLLLEKKKT